VDLIAEEADGLRRLAAGDLQAVLAALEAVREQAAQGRRVLKATASGRRAPATRPGALRDLVEEHLRKFPDTAFAPYQIGKVLTRSAGAVASALGKLVSLGTAQMATGKPRSCRLAIAPAPDAVGGPGTSAEATPRAVGRPAGTSSPAHQREDRLDEALATSSSRAMLRAARASRRCSGPRTADRTPA
jgi:hypothetical protein